MEQHNSSYRWVCLPMVFLVSFSCSACMFAPSVFARELMETLGLTTSQYAAVLTCPTLIGLAISYPSGALGDKIGAKKTVLAGLAITTVAAFLRAFAPSFVMLFLTSLIMGTAGKTLSANVLKIASGWFPVNEIGLAVGVVTASGTAGGAVAQALFGLMFPAFRSAALGCGVLLLVVTALWAILFRDASLPESAPVAENKAESGKSQRSGILRERNLWIMAAGTAVAMGCQFAISGFLTVALPEKGITDAAVGFTASLFTWGALLGGIVLPTALARLRSSKAAGIAMCVGCGALLMVAWFVPQATLSSILLVCSGFLIGAIMPVILSYPAFLPEFGPARTGAVGGVMATCNMVAAFVLPSYIVAPLAAGSNTATFAICAALLLIPAATFALLPDMNKLIKKSS